MQATLEHYMRRYPHTVASVITVDDARTAMLRLGVRHLPVVDGDELVGVVSERDVAFAGRAGAGAKRLADLLSLDRPYAVDVKTNLLHVAEAMAEQKIGSVVILEHGKVAGIFTTIDACRALADALRPRGDRTAIAPNAEDAASSR